MANLWLVFNFYFCVQSYYFLHNWKEMISKQPSLIYLGRTHIYSSLLLFFIIFFLLLSVENICHRTKTHLYI